MNFKIGKGSFKKGFLKILMKKLLSEVFRDGKECSHASLFGDEQCGCSSVVERDLAKVDVESSNLFTRSNSF
jgi:hypothetical protein